MVDLNHSQNLTLSVPDHQSGVPTSLLVKINPPEVMNIVVDEVRYKIELVDAIFAHSEGNRVDLTVLEVGHVSFIGGGRKHEEKSNQESPQKQIRTHGIIIDEECLN